MDTITDDEGSSYYLARIKTDKNFLGSETKPLFLLPGMTASVDIIVGKHTVLEYINAQRTLAESENDYKIAQYRIMNGMGTLLQNMNINLDPINEAMQD